MENEVRKYLDLINEHLQERHAALLVGAGLSRNAAKIDDNVPDSPDWSGLKDIFISKLSSNPVKQEELKTLSPLVLAEHVEITYGRAELDHLLLNSIRDRDFLPSSLHHKLLSLPWSDIFTTNYDTLLERASDEMTEKSFRVVTEKEDLIGSSGTTRIVKLHGSFPSHRPFIITSEDYRTYPLKFAPFVNTVQQALLENTLCLIGFSGNDPNFEKWIGWIRDNLGEDNAPHIYFLIHHRLSEAEQELMRRRKIIPVDLSQLAPEKPVAAVYEAALDYLLEQQRSNLSSVNWDLNQSLRNRQGQLIPMENAVALLRGIRESYPGWLTVPSGRLYSLRHIVSDAKEILAAYCAADQPTSDMELDFLYEYDWLREKSLLPPFSELKFYHQILRRHAESHAVHKFSIQLSILRARRERGNWAEWDMLQGELCAADLHLNFDQRQQLRWEECLCALAQYQFPLLKERLEGWKVEPSMSLWALRKASLLAEYGKLAHAQNLLQQAILDVRRRLSYQRQVNLALLSLESTLMNLQDHISQALDRDLNRSCKDGEGNETEAVNTRHRAVHAQYHVSWEEQNSFFTSRLEVDWKPYRAHRIRSTFDFGKKNGSYHCGPDEERMLAFSFLCFREETGTPFYICNVCNGLKAACGAAERIAIYAPDWSILTLVRADKPKAVENTITRGILSDWTQEEVDQRCQFYLDAVLRTELELRPQDWFYRRSFARLAADVLPEVLSELCTKCSAPVLDKLFDLLERLYKSEKKQCYQQTPSLTKRILAAYPPNKMRSLISQLLLFPVNEEDNMTSHYFPNPLQYIQVKGDYMGEVAEESLPEVEILLDQCQKGEQKSAAMSRLLYYLCYGFLTDEQKLALRDLLWEGQQLHVPEGWLRTICLDLPAPPDINPPQYLSKVLTENVKGYAGCGDRPLNDAAILREIQIVALEGSGAFSGEQVSVIIACLGQQLNSLSGSLSERDDFMGLRETFRFQLYEITHTLWLLTCSQKEWVVSNPDRKTMTGILESCNTTDIYHYGLQSAWNHLLGNPFNYTEELGNCLRSTDERHTRWGYTALANGIRYARIHLLSEDEIRYGIAVLSQQVVWGVPKQLTSALHVAETAVKYQPNLISGEILEQLLTGLSQIKQQTVINADDTVDSASQKGDLRIRAASLAKRMQQVGLCGSRPEILNKWMDVLNDENEFAEIRNV